jgi:hypothetical protein
MNIIKFILNEAKYIKDKKLYDTHKADPEHIESVYGYYGLEDAIGIALVAADVRPACLIEGSAIIAQHVIDKYYKDSGLIISQDMYVSKRVITPAMTNTRKKVGEILGFGKCSSNKTPDANNKRSENYSVSLRVPIKGAEKAGLNEGSDNIYFFALICSNKENMSDMKSFRKNCEDALKKDRVFKDLIGDVKLQIERNVYIPTKEIIDTLISNKEIDADMKDSINNTLNWSNMSLKNFDLKNTWHRGMLATIVSLDTPLQRDEDKKGLLSTLRQTRRQ